MKLYFYNFKDGEVTESCVTARKNTANYMVSDGTYNNSIHRGHFKYWMDDERKLQDILHNPYMFSSTKIEITDELKKISIDIQKSKEKFYECIKNMENAVSINSEKSCLKCHKPDEESYCNSCFEYSKFVK